MVDLSTHRVISSQVDFDQYTARLLPHLLEHAKGQTKRFLRETGQWDSDVVHEKLVQRWGYELLERFMIWGRTKLPCRPVQLFDSFLSEHYSHSERLCILNNTASPLCHFVDSLLSKAVYCRDALIANYYHFYGLNQHQVTKILSLGSVESQRVYKNYTRWRNSGWLRMVHESGMTESDVTLISQQNRRNPTRAHRELGQLLPVLQAHYRKSEPALYPCLSRSQWHALYEEDYGQDYRSWHLAFCQSCLTEVWDLLKLDREEDTRPTLDLHIYPLARAGVLESFCGTGAASQ